LHPALFLLGRTEIDDPRGDAAPVKKGDRTDPLRNVVYVRGEHQWWNEDYGRPAGAIGIGKIVAEAMDTVFADHLERGGFLVDLDPTEGKYLQSIYDGVAYGPQPTSRSSHNWDDS
jgi:hypothetical protein